MRRALTFDDVLLVPQYSSIPSRTDVDLTTPLIRGHIDLKIPIVSSNMDTITEVKMVASMHDMGGAGILHRYAEPDLITEWIRTLKGVGVMAIPSIGSKSSDVELAERYREVGADAICVDVAHGHSEAVLEVVRMLSDREFKIIAGNVATSAGAQHLAQAGAHCVKVGVGPGSLCETRVVTGHGVAQLTAIMNAAEAKKIYPHITIMADGGLRNSGDIVKALAAGADTVMVGSLLAGTSATPLSAWTKDSEGRPAVKYRGMASRDAQVEWRGKVNNDAPEGASMTMPPAGSTKEVVAQLVGGIRSGLSYSGCRTIPVFHKTAEFMEVTSNCVRENGAHRKGG